MIAYEKAKQQQIHIYYHKAKAYRRKSHLFYGLSGLVFILGFIFGILTVDAIDYGTFTEFIVYLLLLGGSVVLFGALCLQGRHSNKSAHLLTQFSDELGRTLQRIKEPTAQRKRILTIETNFLANDDELFTKKFIWRHFLNYLDVKMEWDKDEKERRMNLIRNQVNPMPIMWMKENPLDKNNDDQNFVQLNWEIKLRLRELFFKNYGNQRVILEDLGKEAQRNSIVYERFLRNKKVSKKLKKFKRVVWVNYLNAAAKMKLITFVDSVLQNRDYVDQCDEMKVLIDEKNKQIEKYTRDFWRIHRRSLKFYFFEAIWLGLLIPILIFSVNTFIDHGMGRAFLTFLVGAGIVVFGEMALVTRQLRDLKSKKLVPSLIATLMGIRHSMCADAVTTAEGTMKYVRYFKAAEKRFMLTVTEVEAVKYAKENVTEKVFDKLSEGCRVLREEKDKQAQKYYERFHYYRNQCVKYGALEAFVGLLVFPVIALAIYRTAIIGGLFMEIYMELGFIAIGLTIELVLLIRHIRVDRRKELFLLIYQKMSVILSDEYIYSDLKRLIDETETLEASIVTAASSDNMHDVVSYVEGWIVDNQLRNKQLIDDIDVIYDHVPIKRVFDAAGKKIEEIGDKFRKE